MVDKKGSASQKMSKRKKYNHNYYLEHKKQINLTTKTWQKENRERYNKLIHKWRLANPERHREFQNRWTRENRRSSSHYSLELQDAMNNVRIRDNNTCQWQGCGLTHRQAPIHVHHIFPKKEYPELELVEQYMICYCANHHGLWHRYRGDYYANLILRKGQISQKLMSNT